MAIFTAIGAFVAGALGFTAGTFAFAVVSGVVATAAAMVTSRILNPTPKGGGGTGANQLSGTRIQLPPGTDNKVPVLYGTAYCNPIIIDAYISSSDGTTQDTMTYIMAISETSNFSTSDYTVNDIYWNDLRLEFSGTAAQRGKKRVDASYNEAEDFVDENFKDRVWFGVWRWDALSQSIETIHGDQTPVEFIPDNNWSASYEMQGMVFAAMRMKYDQEKGFTGLPTMTFKITNSTTNPAEVVYDYLTSKRFGCGIGYDEVDIDSFVSWYNYCNENAPWTPIDGGATQYRKRYEINGLINTNNDCKTNIDSLLLSSAAWISYDVQTGLWRLIPKRAQASTITFSDDNIVSGLSLNSTRLEDLYNIVEAQYFDTKNRDQQAYSYINLFDSNPDLLNYNEPENSYSLGLEFCNNNIQAERIANMELEQSRDDLVIKFTAGHWGLQCQAGDVIKVNNSVYGWVSPEFEGGKEFRVMSIREIETEEGSLGAEITALEYNAQVYDDKNITEFYPRENIGIPDTGNSNQLPPPSIVIGDVDNKNSSPSFNVKVKVPSGAGIINEIEIWYAEGDDYAGLGGDSTFLGQIGQAGGANNVLIVTGLPSSNVGKQLYLNTPTAGISSEIISPPAALGAKITAFLTGNGGNGEYQVDSDYQSPISKMSSALLRAKFSGYILDGRLTVTSVAFGNGSIAANCLITGTGVSDGTVITGQVSGSNGGTGVYDLSVNGSTTVKHANLGSSGSPVAFSMRNPFPALSTYKLLTTIRPDAGKTSFTANEERAVSITGLPANAENKKYFLKTRSKQITTTGEKFGAFSELGTVDLEVPSVFWDPNSKNLTNQLVDLKTAVLRLDFGRLVIPNNGLWLLKTMTAMDFGVMRNSHPGPSPYQLDLGSTGVNPENTVDVDVITEEFIWQGDGFTQSYVKPPSNPTPPKKPGEDPPANQIVYLNPFTTGVRVHTTKKSLANTGNWYTPNEDYIASLNKGEEAYIRWQFSFPTGYESLGNAGIEGYLRGRVYDIDSYSGGNKTYTPASDFQVYNYATSAWDNLTDCSKIPVNMTKAPGGQNLAPSLSFGFLRIRYNPTTWPTGTTRKVFAFDTLPEDGTENPAVGTTPATVTWLKT